MGLNKGKGINEGRNLTMVMDFYELTMANGYFEKGRVNEIVVFDMFYRSNPDKGGFVITAGQEQLIDYIQNMHFTREDIEFLETKKVFSKEFLTYLANFKFTGDIFAVPEGTIVYPNTPIVTVRAPLVEAQLVETMLLLTINHQSLIATKASRMVRAAQGRPIMEFGARRAHGYDAAIYGARAAYIAGVSATANIIADQYFDVPAIGTMAHSWIQYFEDEFEAFKEYAITYPNSCTLLVDTYNVLKSGVPNAIRVAKEVLEPLGHTLKGIRLDSGDLAYLSKEARKMLDDAGLTETKIIVSNSIDEYLITSLIQQDAKIDSFGIGERLITAKSNPVFGGVYKVVAVNKNGHYEPRIKISETIEKVTNPGYKKYYRVYDEHGMGMFDVLAGAEELIDIATLDVVDQEQPWKKIPINPLWSIKELQIQFISKGKLIVELPTLSEIRQFVTDNLNHVWDEEKRFENPHKHYVDLTRELFNVKTDLLSKVKA